MGLLDSFFTAIFGTSPTKKSCILFVFEKEKRDALLSASDEDDDERLTNRFYLKHMVWEKTWNCT